MRPFANIYRQQLAAAVTTSYENWTLHKLYHHYVLNSDGTLDTFLCQPLSLVVHKQTGTA